MRVLRLGLVVGLLTSAAVLSALQQAPAQVLDNVRTVGEVVADKGVLTVKGAKATLLIGKPDADTYRLTAEVKLADKATCGYLQVMPADGKNANKQAVLHAFFCRDAPGLKIQASTYRWDAHKGQWGATTTSSGTTTGRLRLRKPLSPW
jgi:hypothetical protein